MSGNGPGTLKFLRKTVFWENNTQFFCCFKYLSYNVTYFVLCAPPKSQPFRIYEQNYSVPGPFLQDSLLSLWWILLCFLSSSGSRPCPGQLLKTSRSTETQRHSLVSGLELEIDSIITPYHHHPPTHHLQENFFEQNNIEISSFMNSLDIIHFLVKILVIAL